MRSKKLLLLYISLLIVAVSTMVQLWRHQQPQHPLPLRDYPEIQKEGILRMITEYNQSGYFVAGDTIQGFQYELCQAISQISGLEIQTQLEMSLDKSFQELTSNHCDVVARNIPITSDLRENYLFTEPIVFNKQVLVQRNEAANGGKTIIRNQLDLAQKTLYIPKHSPALLRIKNLEHEIGDTIYVVEEELYSSEQLMIMVAKGDIDYAVCDQQLAQQLLEQLPELDIQTDISFTQLQSWSIRKTSPILLDSLNHWLKQIKDSGLYDQIYRRYYK